MHMISLMVANGAPYEGDPTKNESYFVFGKEIIAPCDAKVVMLIDGIKDNIPGELNKVDLTGNTDCFRDSQKRIPALCTPQVKLILNSRRRFGL